MTQAFWHDAITDKSFVTLQEIRKLYDFVLIGGWAIFMYTKGLKSKDIDIIVEAETLGRLKSQHEVVKNQRLKKYEIKLEGFDIDIYLSHWSELGLPASYIHENAISIDGFKVPQKEVLLILKLVAYQQRKGSLKGKKDALDILSLLNATEVDFKVVKKILETYRLKNLEQELLQLISSVFEVKEIGLHRKKYADFKKKLLQLL